jgi:hypothetical protein
VSISAKRMVFEVPSWNVEFRFGLPYELYDDEDGAGFVAGLA